ncbi:MAG: right-handed parallel beta-helix repeat-containing protein [Lachnospiraceae bacterium]|nr:right-handed parallel beta-helix repeat-containing protein [Lachnospiraceae bacterium]
MKRNNRFVYTLSAAGILMAGAVLFTSPQVNAHGAEKSYKAKGTLFTVTKAKGNIADEVNAAIKDASKKAAKNKKHYTVRLKKGSYSVQKSIHLYSGVTLDATGAVLKSTQAYGNMVMSADADINKSKKKGSGYKAFRDIGLVGGTWKSPAKNRATIMRMGHGKKLTVKKVTLDGGGGIHQLELASIDGITVKDCTFKNLKFRSGENKQEALQFDVTCNTSVFPDYVMDATPTKNIKVEGCTFTNVPRGVGTHTLLLGNYFNHVTIRNNTFQKIREEAVIALNYHDFLIEGNRISDSGAGILVQAFKAAPSSVWTTIQDGKKKFSGKIVHDAAGVVRNNTVSIQKNSKADEVCGIKLYGMKLKTSAKGGDGTSIKKGDYYLSGVTVEGNTIRTTAMGIHLMDAKKCVVRNNTMIGTGTDKEKSKNPKGIFLANTSTDNKILGNTIEKFYSNGILLQDASSATDISGNTLSGIGSTSSVAAIKLTVKGTHAGEITDNRITKGKYGFGCTGDAILVTGGAKAHNIEKNKIEGAGGHDVKVAGGKVDHVDQEDAFIAYYE